MKILFLGSSRFSQIVLQKLIDHNQNIVFVITQPDSPKGRGYKMTPTIVKEFALEKGIRVECYDRVKNHIEEIKNIDYDLAVVASFSQILPQEFLDIKLALNVHPSLLPKYRGPSPIQSAILNGDKTSGVTIMKVVKALDSGDIVKQQTYDIAELYYLDAEERLATLGGELLLEAIDDLEKNQIKFVKQNDEEATYTRKFTSEDGKLNFNASAKEVVSRIRALSENVGCFIEVENMKIKVLKAETVSLDNIKPCQIADRRKQFLIGCQDGAVEIKTCVAPSGKTMSGRDFLNGQMKILGKDVLC